MDFASIVLVLIDPLALLLQGRLMRTIMYSNERVSANNWEAGLFILFLLVFAIAASWHVFSHGIQVRVCLVADVTESILMVQSYQPYKLRVVHVFSVPLPVLLQQAMSGVPALLSSHTPCYGHTLTHTS